MKARNIDGKPRVFGVRRTPEQIERWADFFKARSVARSGEEVVVSYDEGETWYELGRSPVSRDDRKH